MVSSTPLYSFDMIPSTPYFVASKSTSVVINHRHTMDSVTLFSGAKPYSAVASLPTRNAIAALNDWGIHLHENDKNSLFKVRGGIDMAWLSPQIVSVVGTSRHLELFDLRKGYKPALSQLVGDDCINSIDYFDNNPTIVACGNSNGNLYKIDLRGQIEGFHKRQGDPIVSVTRGLGSRAGLVTVCYASGVVEVTTGSDVIRKGAIAATNQRVEAVAMDDDLWCGGTNLSKNGEVIYNAPVNLVRHRQGSIFYSDMAGNLHQG